MIHHENEATEKRNMRGRVLEIDHSCAASTANVLAGDRDLSKRDIAEAIPCFSGEMR